MTKATLIQAPIKGVLGTDINVGDKVMVVTTGYSHNVSVNKGTYLGYIEGAGYYKQRARVAVDVIERKWHHKVTGEEWNWTKHGRLGTTDFEVRETPGIRMTTLCLNRIATLKD